MDRRAFLRRSGLGVGVGIAASQLTLVQEGATPPTRRPPRRPPRSVVRAHRLQPLLGRLRGRRGRRERRLGAPGAGVRFADQPGRALRQGRRDARARPWRLPAEVPDEARQRQVPAHLAGTRRSNEISAKMLRAAQGRAGPDAIVLDRLVQAQQRAGVSAAQVGVPVGHQQLRPPGAHLPLHHGRRRREHLGLRRDDEFVQRHAELEGGAVHRLATRPKRTRSRCCTCCTPRRRARR